MEATARFVRRKDNHERCAPRSLSLFSLLLNAVQWTVSIEEEEKVFSCILNEQNTWQARRLLDSACPGFDERWLDTENPQHQQFTVRNSSTLLTIRYSGTPVVLRYSGRTPGLRSVLRYSDQYSGHFFVTECCSWLSLIYFLWSHHKSKTLTDPEYAFSPLLTTVFFHQERLQIWSLRILWTVPHGESDKHIWKNSHETET